MNTFIALIKCIIFNECISLLSSDLEKLVLPLFDPNFNIHRVEMKISYFLCSKFCIRSSIKLSIKSKDSKPKVFIKFRAALRVKDHSNKESIKESRENPTKDVQYHNYQIIQRNPK